MHTKLYIERRERGLDQKEMAHILGVHHNTYHAKEKGKKDFSLREAKILAKFFDTTLNELFGEETA